MIEFITLLVPVISLVIAALSFLFSLRVHRQSKRIAESEARNARALGTYSDFTLLASYSLEHLDLGVRLVGMMTRTTYQESTKSAVHSHFIEFSRLFDDSITRFTTASKLLQVRISGDVSRTIKSQVEKLETGNVEFHLACATMFNDRVNLDAPRRELRFNSILEQHEKLRIRTLSLMQLAKRELYTPVVMKSDSKLLKDLKDDLP